MKTKNLILIFLGSLVVSIACAEVQSADPRLSNPLGDVRFWAYQIQGEDERGDIQKLADSHYDLLVIDQTRSLKGEDTYNSKADVALLKNSTNSSNGKKIVICYLDIGEAESYRWYWHEGWRIGSPKWIVAEDPDGWDENYPVEFWHKDWKAVIIEYLDRIIEDGYDGVYLDWLEIYSFDPVVRKARREGLDIVEELINFIRELRGYALSKNKDFLFIAQNAAELVEYPEYVGLFDGIAQEAIWYDGGGDPDISEEQGDVPVEPDDSATYIMYLREWQKAGKVVFNVEYTQKPHNVEQVYKRGKEYGFITYVTLRLLDSLTTTPPPDLGWRRYE